MKNIVLLLILVFSVSSCNVFNKKENIIYFLPNNVNEMIINEIQKPIYKTPYLVMGNEGENYVVYVCRGKHPIFVKYSHRVVLIKGRQIPLYFYSDEYFAYAQKGSEVLKRLGTEKPLIKKIAIRENSFSIIFNLSGEIIN